MFKHVFSTDGETFGSLAYIHPHDAVTPRSNFGYPFYPHSSWFAVVNLWGGSALEHYQSLLMHWQTLKLTTANFLPGAASLYEPRPRALGQEFTVYTVWCKTNKLGPDNSISNE